MSPLASTYRLVLRVYSGWLDLLLLFPDFETSLDLILLSYRPY
jgi:hypothetical protein